jgi:hypothetical protein
VRFSVETGPTATGRSKSGSPRSSTSIC